MLGLAAEKKTDLKLYTVPHPRSTMDMNDSLKQHVSFDGPSSSKIACFLFAYENVIMRGKSDEENALQLLCHVECAVFDRYYEDFALDRA